MGFVNEMVSIEDIQKYNLPFPNDVPESGRRWWTRDKERNLYLWGGAGGNPAFGLDMYHRFYLFIDGKLFDVKPKILEESKNIKVVPYRIVWADIENIEAMPYGAPKLHGMDYDELVKIFKEAMIIYGSDGRNKFTPVFTVEFKF